MLLTPYADTHGGVVLGEVGFRLREDPATVRTPDVSYVPPDRVPQHDVGKFWPGAPEIAIEIVSSGDTLSDVQTKVLDYLAAGSGWAWVVNPTNEKVTVHRPNMDAHIYSRDDTISGQDAPAGLVLGVDEVFGKWGA